MDNSFYLKNGSVLWNGAFTPLDMAVEDGHITALSRGHHNEKGLPEVDAAGLRVLPGFLDLHTHGATGVDVNAADAEGLRTIGRFFASQGVTGWLCSVLTDTPEQTLWCMEQARQVIEGGPCGGAALLGVHLEGPCLSSEYKGAMPEHLLMHTADAELFAKYQKASGGHVRYTTLAPEIPGVPGLIPRLNAMGIVCAMGHSGAGYDQCVECVEAGVRSVTHLGNAMRLFHQHDPAIFGVALERDVYVEAICDGRHLHPGTVRLYLKAKGYDRVVAVTDSIMAAALARRQLQAGSQRRNCGERGRQAAQRRPGRLHPHHGPGPAQPHGLHRGGAETVSRLMTANPARLMGWAGKGSWTWERTPIWSCWTAITRWPAPWWAGAPSIQDKGITERRIAMPLVPLRPVLDATVKYGYAQGAFNVNAVAQAEAVIAVHEMFRSPAILQGADLANAFMGGRVDFANGTLEDKKKGARNIAEAVKKFAEQSPIPVVLHLDHGKNFDSCVAAIEGGYTSVMIDGSALPFEENVELTREVVKYAHARGVSVEGELGVLAGVEDHVFAANSTYTNPLSAIEFFKKTGVDALAISYGTMHGASKGKDVKLRKEIPIAIKECMNHEGIQGALVSHGSSTVPQYIVNEINALGGNIQNAYGISKEELKAAIPCGIGKINVDTDIRLAVTRNFRELFRDHPELKEDARVGGVWKLLDEKRDAFDPRAFLAPIMDTVMYGTGDEGAVALITDAMRRGVKEAVGTLIVEFGSYGKAPLVEPAALEDMAARYAKEG
ncbi:MAG: ketose-bisphosphate aldolase [Flavonifractor plautii]